MSNKFNNKVALITGAGSGIGKSTALLLAQQGVSVVVSDINLEAAQKVVDEIVALGGKAAANKANTAEPEDMKAAVEFAVSTFGALHLAFNNAGILGEVNSTEELSIEGWRRVIDVNLNAVFYSMHYEVPAILAAGGRSDCQYRFYCRLDRDSKYFRLCRCKTWRNGSNESGGIGICR